jgi:hypothetical protein
VNSAQPDLARPNWTVEQKIGSYQGGSWVLDSPESVRAGQAAFEYPATSVLFSNYRPE